MKIPNWFEFINNAHFKYDCGLCANIHRICGKIHKRAEGKFLKFLSYRNISIKYPITEHNYSSVNSPVNGEYVYDNHHSNGTLYCGKQLMLRKHLYKEFRVWLRKQK